MAPLALLLSLAAVAGVVASTTGSGDDGDNDRERANERTTEQQRPDRQQQRRVQRGAYTVKLNDTLELISQKTGVPVERLQTLNPELDPQNLVVGQKIKLRE